MILEILLCLCYRSRTESEMDASETLSLRSGAGLEILSLQLTFIIKIIILSFFSQKEKSSATGFEPVQASPFDFESNSLTTRTN